MIVLDGGTEVQADALLCGTGWMSNYPFFSEEVSRSLGLPHDRDDSLEDLLAAADRQILEYFPQLGNPPPHSKPERSSATKLYKGIAPLDDHSVAFLGHMDVSNAFRAAEAQSIWATAYFDGSMRLPPLQKRQEDVAYMNAFSRRRYPSRGQSGDCLFFELVWYTDSLMAELGLKSHRKGWWSNLVTPLLASDLEGVRDEYKVKFGF